MRDSTLNRKVHFACGVALLAFAVLSFLSYRTAVQSDDVSRWVAHTHKVIETLKDLEIAMGALESSARGFVLTSDESYVASYRASREAAERSDAAVGSLTVDNPAQQRRFRLLETVVARRAESAEAAIQLRRVKGLEAAAGALPDLHGQQIMSEFHAQVGALENEEFRLLALRVKEKRRREGQTKVILILGILTGLLITVVTFWKVRRDNFSRVLFDKEMSESEERFRNLANNISQLAWMADEKGSIFWYNRRWFDYTGTTLEEMAGWGWQKVHHPDHVQGVVDKISRCFQSGEVWDDTFPLRGRDGVYRWFLSRAVPILDAEGKVLRWFGTNTDITESKILEAELAVARDRALDSVRTKAEFLANMSHEIRTPMNAILGMADMLWESELEAEQRSYVEVFRRAGASLLVLINDILDLSKIEAGHLDLERVEFDLEEVVNQAIELTAVNARAKGIQLVCHLAAGLATALIGDPTRLRQILINILGNAVKFTESGEVVLTVQNRGKSGEIEVTVSDTGIGIPSDKLETIFDDFTQAGASTTRKFGGTGLGLGISRRIVEAMGGRLTATSSAGKGSTFRFTAQFELPPAGTRKVRLTPVDLHGKRVLVIDGNAANSFILQETLQSWGLICDTLRLPAEALKHLPEAMSGANPYSLVIVDKHMPGMDGFEATAEIRRIAGDLPVAMLSSEAKPEDIARRLEAGLSGYAVKPVARMQLLRLVCDAMAIADGGEPSQSAARKEDVVTPARILVAEDSPVNRMLLQLYLRDSPYELTFEEDGKAVVDRFDTSDFDLILMDVRMPVMDGLDATRAIREIERERGSLSIPIVALTANASLLDFERSADAGCNAHLSKPISKRELLTAIEKYRRQSKPVEKAPIGSPATIAI